MYILLSVSRYKESDISDKRFIFETIENLTLQL